MDEMKFRKKPIIIEAEQYKGLPVKGVCYCKEALIFSLNPPAHVHTIHDNQSVMLEIGDWIIPEADGIHFYPVKPDVFENSYDKIEHE